jgi:hypothetical protein
MIKRSLLFVFWLQVATAFLVVGQAFILSIGDSTQLGWVSSIPLIISSLVGGILIFLTKKSETKGNTRRFLMLTGISSASFFIYLFLHSLFYALVTITSNSIFLDVLLFLLEKTFTMGFFLLTIIVCPIAFCVGTIGSIILLIKNREKKSVKAKS